MTFNIITTLEGFEFYRFNQGSYYELWIMNRERTIMKFVYGSYDKIGKGEVNRLYSKNYFDSYMYDINFTDQED